MDEIKNWGLMLLSVSVGSLIYCFLLPSGNISKTAKSVLSVLVLASICSPMLSFFENIGEISSHMGEEAPTIKDFSDEYISAAKSEIEKIIAETVKEYTRVSYKTEIIIDKNEDGSINIGYIGITFSALPEKKEELRDALYAKIGLMPDIGVE